MKLDRLQPLFSAPRVLVFNTISAGFLLALLWGLLMSPQWSWEHMLAAFFAAGLAAPIGNFEHIETFKASSSGFEAKTREVVRQAESVIKELHELAAQTGTHLVELIVGVL